MSLPQGSYTRDYATLASAKDAKGGYPRFFMEAEKDEAASVTCGRPIFRDIEMVEIIIPSIAQYSKPVMRVRQDHIDRWPREYEAFKNGQEMPLDGTPLEEWNILTRANILELKSFNFRTVEDVAEMTEHAIQRLGMNGRPLKLKAAAYLDEAEKNRVVNEAVERNEQMQQALAERDYQISQLNETVANLGNQVRALIEQRAQPVDGPRTTSAAPTTVELPRGSSLDRLAARLTPAERISKTAAELAAFDQVGPDTGNAENLVIKRRPGRPSKAALAAAGAPR